MPELSIASPDTDEPQATETLLIHDAVDPSRPVEVEVVVVKDGLVPLEKWIKILAGSVTFFATKHLLGWLAFPAALFAMFNVDIVAGFVRQRGWGKRQVRPLALLSALLAEFDQHVTNALARIVPEPFRRLVGGARRAGGHVATAGHAVATTAVATVVCAVVIAVPAFASGSSPFGTSTAPGLSGPAHPVLVSRTPQAQVLRVGVSAAGVPGTVAVAPGQRVELRFHLERASTVVLATGAETTLTAFTISRDGGQDQVGGDGDDEFDPYVPNSQAPLAAGNHTVTIEPSGRGAGRLQFVLYAATERYETVHPSPVGTAGTITLTPGQPAQLRFTLRTPSEVTFAVGADSTLKDFNISHDGGQDGSGYTASDDPGDPYTPASQPVVSAGTHTITIDPAANSAGMITYRLTARPA